MERERVDHPIIIPALKSNQIYVPISFQHTAHYQNMIGDIEQSRIMRNDQKGLTSLILFNVLYQATTCRSVKIIGRLIENYKIRFSA